MAYKLVSATDAHMTRPQLGLPRGIHFYPSEASADWIDHHSIKRVAGTCMRQAWYRCTGTKTDGKADAYSEWIFALGKAVECILVEQWKQMGIWVANNVKFYEEKHNISGELDVVLSEPNGTLFGVECCTPDSLVLDHNYHLIPFEKLIQTRVVSSEGHPVAIRNLQIKSVDHEPIYRFRSKFDGLQARFTGEHPILTAKVRISRLVENQKARSYHFEGTSWIKACDIKPGDYLCIPKANFGFTKDHLFYNEDTYTKYRVLMEKSNWNFRIENGQVYPDHNHLSTYKPIPDTIKNLYDFYWLLGLYLAEGSCSESTVYFSLHKEETEIIERIRKTIKELWGLEIHIQNLNDSRTGELSKGINVSVSSIPVRELFKHLVPGNTINRDKHLNYDRISSDPKLLEQILLGVWQGDGCFVSDHQYRVVTTVPNLAYLYFQIAAHIGLSPRLSKYDQASQFNSEYIYAVEWGSGGNKNNIEKLVDGGNFWCYKVKDIEVSEYTGLVYNLECDEHTYTVGGIATHNCKSFYGYQATRDIIGNKHIVGKPKTSQLLQTLVYVDLCRRLGIIQYFKMIYYARDSAARKEFDISLVQDGEHLRPTIDGVIDYRFTMQDIYDRYDQLAAHIKNNDLPPRDFGLVWDAEKVEERRELGEVSDTAYKDWKKKPDKNPIGDWQCRYCPYTQVCYEKK